MNAEALERVRRRLVDTGAPPGRAAIAALVRQDAGGLAGHGQVLDLVREAESELAGAGPLQPLLQQPGVTDVLVNAPDSVWVDRGAGLQRSAVRFPSEAAVRGLAQRLAAAAGRRLDDASPYVDAALPDGTRLHAVLPPVAPGGTCLSLRTFTAKAFTIAELEAAGTLRRGAAGLLWAIIRARAAFLVSGGTGSGKTTLLASMLGLVDPAERLILVEDAPELRPAHPHVVRLTARPANVEGAGEVSLRDLVRQALRMRPDRLVVGEVRGGEVVELLTALNTGHAGSSGTLHANSAGQLPARLEALGALGRLDRHAVRSQVAAALQVAIHLDRLPDGHRVLAEIGVFRRDGEEMRVVPAWRHDAGPVDAWADLARILEPHLERSGP
ncbi:MAG TPA: TadA family conjugal transfer-associated ATPase [Mycobacteriales bacterium]|jgi:pilus assembly protein CpaF|nr:TadA family conjugal transfer-associated ATPase [Mycobacteriales bacterium]